MKDPELEPSANKIDKLIRRIDSGDIRIPAFQRGYVWKQNQILELLDSIVANFPIGSILVWYTSEKLKHTRNIAGYLIPETKIEYPVNYVLDGQQRISTIYAVFSDKTEQDKASEQYNPNLNIFEIYYDFQDKKFKPVSEVDITSDYVISLKYLKDAPKLFTVLSKLNPLFHSDASDLCSKFLNYEVPVVTISFRTKEEVGLIFERINSTGTKLSTLDLMTAWTWTDNFLLLDEANKLTAELEEKKFGQIPYQIILQTISAIIQDDTTTQSILKLSGETLRDNWNLVCESMRRAVDFISTELMCVNSEFLPYIQQIVPISKFFSLKGTVTNQQIIILKKWFWKTSFSNRYSAGTTPFKMNIDLETVKRIRKDEEEDLLNYKSTVTKQELLATKFSKGNYLTRAFLLLMAQKNPFDLQKATLIDIDRALSYYNRTEFHHVFPKVFLKEKGLPEDKINSLLNFCFLPADSNKKISRKEPKVYFFNIIPTDKFKEILESNILPLDKTIYQNNDFNSFLDKRADKVLNEIEKISN